MQDVSDKLLAQSTSCLETKLGTAEEEPTEEPAGDAAPSEEKPSPDATTAASAAEPTAFTPTGQQAEAVDASAKHQAGFDESSATAKAAPRPSSAESTPAAALDLGATVLPVLVKRYGVADRPQGSFCWCSRMRGRRRDR